MPRFIHPSYFLLAFFIGIIIGDVAILSLKLDFFVSPIWILVVVLVLLACLKFQKPSLLILAFIAGFIAIGYRLAPDISSQHLMTKLIDQEITISGVVAEDPDSTESKTALRLKKIKLHSTSTQKLAGLLYVSLPKNSSIKRSDVITITGNLKPGFGSFIGTFYRPKIIRLDRPEPGDIMLKIRDQFAANITKYISAPSSYLNLGYLLGIRSSLPTDLSETLRVVGLTHIIVASGANLSILIAASRKIFGKISYHFSFLISISLVLGFIGIVGLTSSMVRAGLVSIFSLLANFFGRQFAPTKLLLMVSSITIFYQPNYLIDLGWLLSFASFFGILVVGPILTNFFYGKRKPNFIFATLLETLSASIICAPILLYFFGTLSLISLAANLIILPTISIVMLTTLLTGIFSAAPIIAGTFGKISEAITSFHLFIINFFGEQTIFLIEIPKENPLVFFLFIPIMLPIIVIVLAKHFKGRYYHPNLSQKFVLKVL